MTKNEPGRLRELLEQFTSNRISESGLDELCELVKQTEDEELRGLMEADLRVAAYKEMNKEKLERMLQTVWMNVEREKKVVKMFSWKKLAVAASVVAVLFAGWWLMKDKMEDDGPQTTVVQTDVKAPDKNRASIKLADGTIVYLDSSGNGQLAVQQGVKVVKSADGVLEYSRGSGMVSGELEYNTVNNPRGSKVMAMTLSDGSKVWLNAGSTITYPVAFIGNERKVEINGEGYFEVAHNASKPFVVSKNDISVVVLGTHFNVNAYDDESDVRVTLLEGSVEVKSKVGSGKSKVIKPGEQAQVASGELSVDKNVDIDEVMAWKNQQFIFERLDLASIMRQLSRWYDIEVNYEGKMPANKFSGVISRTRNISAVLEMLKGTGDLQFKVEGKKITVLNTP